MKRMMIPIFLLALFALLIAANRRVQTSIVGRVNPVAGANMVVAVSGHDSSSSTIVNGAFNLEAKPGIYRVVIDAVEPYKDAVLENINVKDGQTVDVGEIMLQK
ncbi:MAG TPA: carboxypeptidase regulatory-like domain-containing protein [Chitinophagaceae bacterium]